MDSLRVGSYENVTIQNPKEIRAVKHNHNRFGTMTVSIIIVMALMILLPTSEALGQRQLARNETQLGNFQNSNAFLVYSNSTYGIRISYPRSWRKYEEADGVIFRDDDQWYGGFVPAVVVGSEHAYGLSLNEYTAESIAGFREDLDSFMIIEAAQRSSLSGVDATKLAFSFTMNDTLMKTMAIWTVSNGEAFLILYVSPAISYSRNLNDVEFMIASFQINTDFARSATNFALDMIHKNSGNIIKITVMVSILGVIKLVKRIKKVKNTNRDSQDLDSR